MNIVTSADSNFFHCLQELAESVRKHYNKQIIVYDIGLADEQRKNLDAIITPIDVVVDFQKHATSSKGPFIKATHKPFCVKHYFENYSEPMILVDADCLFMEKVEEYGFDVGVTLKPRNRIDISNHYSGVLNSGVIFFNTNASELINKWVDECQKDNTTDQKALTDILSETIDWKHYNKVYDWHGLKVKVFKTDEYNDYYLKNGKIFHFKGERHTKDVYQKLLKAKEEKKDIYTVFRRLDRKERNFWTKLLSGRLFGKSR